MFKSKIFLIFSSGGHYGRQSETICAIVVDGIIRNISVKFFFEFLPVGQEKMSFEAISNS